MSAQLPDIGSTLKSLRHARGWSLTLAADKTGVSKAMLGQIERGESSPTVATLWKIATGFTVPFSLFLTGNASVSARALHHDEALTGETRASQSAMRATPVFPFDEQLGFDMLSVILPAGATSKSSAHEQGVIEHVVLLSGELELTVVDVKHQLSAGEGLRFAADCPHRYRNTGKGECHFHSLIHYP